MKKIIIFTLLLLLTTLPATAKGIKTHMDGMRQHGGARSAIPSVMVDQESAYVTVEISRYSGWWIETPPIWILKLRSTDITTRI